MRSSRPPKARRKHGVRTAAVLTIACGVMAAFTAMSAVMSLQRHGHLHIDLRLIFVDGVFGVFAAIEWTMWAKGR